MKGFGPTESNVTLRLTKDQSESFALNAEMDNVKLDAAEKLRVDSSDPKPANGDDPKPANGDDPKPLKPEENPESTPPGTNSRVKNVNQQRKNLLAHDLEKAQCVLRDAENDLEIAEHDLEETKDALKTTEKSLLEELNWDEKTVEMGEVLAKSDSVEESEDENEMVLAIKEDSESNEAVVEIKNEKQEEEEKKVDKKSIQIGKTGPEVEKIDIGEVEPQIEKMNQEGEMMDQEDEKVDQKDKKMDLEDEKMDLEDEKTDPENEKADQKSLKSFKEDSTKDSEEAPEESPICLESEKLINIPEQREENSEGQMVESELREAAVKREEEREECKVEEPKHEVGIVGEPTAVTELINEEELGVEPTLSIEAKSQDDVAQWVENSVKVDERFSDGELENVETLLERKRANKRKKRSEVTSRKQRHMVNHIIKRSIKCLNKMHAVDENKANGKKLEVNDKREEELSRQSPQVPQSQQNGAALPEETAAAASDRLHASVKQETYAEATPEVIKKSMTTVSVSKQQQDSRPCRSDERGSRKRRANEEVVAENGSTNSKKICIDERQNTVSSLITGYDNATAEELASKAEVLRAELQALDDMVRTAEMEWNKVLTMKKLKEEAYLRIERRRQIVNFMEGGDKLTLGERLPPNSEFDFDSRGSASNAPKEKSGPSTRDEHGEGISQENSGICKTEKASKYLQNPLSRHSADARKQAEALESRQIGEGRQGTIIDVKSIIADYRSRHPETVPRSSDHDCRGRRMRNNVNIGLGTGGAIIETGQNTDSRPSSTDSCKSNSNVDANNSMYFKDVLVQFSKCHQQQGESMKTPQNYPDVTLHPVAPAPTIQNLAPQQTGSLLHGILTKAQSPRPTTFSPTLARLLTAPERERSTPASTATSHTSSSTQRILQAYHESNPVSISDLLSSSKARTEITITPVVNAPVQSVQSLGNNMMHVDDMEEETGMMDERDSRISVKGEERDISPRCQGCHERAAQYVCAGCGNQWYCSPECQSAAWDEHSEVCSG